MYQNLNTYSHAIIIKLISFICCVLLQARPAPEGSKEDRVKDVDEERYPEHYRITSDKIKGSNDNTSEPFRVARIIAIKINGKKASVTAAGSASDDESPQLVLKPESVIAVLQKYYRPENTHRGRQAAYQSRLNTLYWSEEEVSVAFSEIVGKCHVVYGDNLTCSEDEFFLQGPYRFSFTQAYDPVKKMLEDPPSEALRIGAAGKGGKGKGKGSSKCVNDTAKDGSFQQYPDVSRRLRTLDVFSGCGGLSEGFHQAGVAESCWAIEVFEPAANAFRLNNPDATVFTDDCNVLLKMVMDGQASNSKGQKLPKKGDVELLCGGPPCQGFSGMNRFNSRLVCACPERWGCCAHTLNMDTHCKQIYLFLLVKLFILIVLLAFFLTNDILWPRLLS